MLLGFGVFQVPDEQTEQVVTDALAASGIAREELFITTKLWIQHTGEYTARREFDGSLARLGLDYLDLYLIHQPLGDYYSSWRALQKLYGEGLAKAIGVSSFYPDRLVDLIQHNDIVPAVNQVETHPFFQREADQQLIREHGVQIESWGPQIMPQALRAARKTVISGCTGGESSKKRKRADRRHSCPVGQP